MSAQLLEVSLLGAGTLLGLERDAWSMVKLLRRPTNEYPPPLPALAPRPPPPLVGGPRAHPESGPAHSPPGIVGKRRGRGWDVLTRCDGGVT